MSYLPHNKEVFRPSNDTLLDLAFTSLAYYAARYGDIERSTPNVTGSIGNTVFRLKPPISPRHIAQRVGVLHDDMTYSQASLTLVKEANKDDPLKVSLGYTGELGSGARVRVIYTLSRDQTSLLATATLVDLHEKSQIAKWDLLDTEVDGIWEISRQINESRP